MNDQPDPADGGDPMPELSGSEDLAAMLLRARAVAPPPRPGLIAVLDRFQILGVLGQGGMGVVLLAHDPASDSKVAVKLLRPELVRETPVVKRFLTEARHMQRMEHPRILRVSEVCDQGVIPYYVMPYKPRGSLAGLIRPGEPLGSELILSVAADAAEALAYAHARGIIHRDVKPLNVLLDTDDHACLADFGLVRAFDHNESTLEPDRQARVGTVAYLSPAIVRREAEDTRCDIYAFGAMLYEMLTGQPPYLGESREAVLAQILAGPPVPIRSRNPKAPASLTAIAEGCMARELRERYASMNDVLADLKRVEAGQPPMGPRGRIDRSRRGRPWMILAGAALLLAAGVWSIRHFGDHQVPRSTPTASLPATERAMTTGIAAILDDAALRSTHADWPAVFQDDLTSESCLKRAYLCFPQTYGTHNAAFDVIPGEGLKIGWGMCNIAWINCLVADEYALSVEFKPFRATQRTQDRGTAVWLNGPGYGASSRLGCRFWVSADGQTYLFTDRSAEFRRIQGRLEQPLDRMQWHRLAVLRKGSRFAVWVNGRLLFDEAASAPSEGYLSSYVGIGGEGGWFYGPGWHDERASDPVFRNLSISMPPVQADRLSRLPLERQWDGRDGVMAAPNGHSLLTHDFVRDGLAGWQAPVDAECAVPGSNGLAMTEWGRSPLVWYDQPLHDDFAVEVETEFLPELAPHGFFIYLAVEDPRAVNDSNYHGWFLALPAAWSENHISWLAAEHDRLGRTWSDASRPRRSVAYEPYFIPVPGRTSVFRLERTGAHLKIFANGRFLMEGDAPNPPDALGDLYLGVGKGFGPKVIRSVRIWSLPDK